MKSSPLMALDGLGKQAKEMFQGNSSRPFKKVFLSVPASGIYYLLIKTNEQAGSKKDNRLLKFFIHPNK